MTSSAVTAMTRAAVHASSGAQWGDIPTWALAVIALLALIAAVAAYYKQADAAKKLAEQVTIQRDQFKDQREANSKQAEMLDAQLREMQQRESVIERQQADAITLTPSQHEGPVPGLRNVNGPGVHMALIGNESHRPVRNVVCRIQPALGEPMHEAAMVGRMVEERFAPRVAAVLPDPTYDRLVNNAVGTKIDLVRAGERAAFIFIYEVSLCPGIMTLRFTDDAGLYWQIDHDLHLQKLDSRDDW